QVEVLGCYRSNSFTGRKIAELEVLTILQKELPAVHGEGAACEPAIAIEAPHLSARDDIPDTSELRAAHIAKPPAVRREAQAGTRKGAPLLAPEAMTHAQVRQFPH